MDGNVGEAKSRVGSHYELSEIALICIFKECPEARTRLAKLLGRSEGGIEWVWAWRDREGKFQKGSFNAIVRQVNETKETLGEEVLSAIDLG
jgi:hypothetical protein